MMAAIAVDVAPQAQPSRWWAIWLFALIFAGACVWFVMAVMRGDKKDKP